MCRFFSDAVTTTPSYTSLLNKTKPKNELMVRGVNAGMATLASGSALSEENDAVGGTVMDDLDDGEDVSGSPDKYSAQ